MMVKPKYPESRWQIIKDLSWKEWLLFVVLSVVVAWILLVPFVNFLEGVK